MHDITIDTESRAGNLLEATALRWSRNGKFWKKKTRNHEIFGKNHFIVNYPSVFTYVYRVRKPPRLQSKFLKLRDIMSRWILAGWRTLIPCANKKYQKEKKKNHKYRGNRGSWHCVKKIPLRGESTSQRGGVPRIYVACRKLIAAEAPNISEHKTKKVRTQFHFVLWKFLRHRNTFSLFSILSSALWRISR